MSLEHGDLSSSGIGVYFRCFNGQVGGVGSCSVSGGADESAGVNVGKGTMDMESGNCGPVKLRTSLVGTARLCRLGLLVHCKRVSLNTYQGSDSCMDQTLKRITFPRTSISLQEYVYGYKDQTLLILMRMGTAGILP